MSGKIVIAIDDRPSDCTIVVNCSPGKIINRLVSAGQAIAATLITALTIGIIIMVATTLSRDDLKIQLNNAINAINGRHNTIKLAATNNSSPPPPSIDDESRDTAISQVAATVIIINAVIINNWPKKRPNKM